jgi:hypothetical protein
MSAISPISQARTPAVTQQAARPAKPVDADGDHDGTKAAAPRPAPALATGGTLGTRLNTKA